MNTIKPVEIGLKHNLSLPGEMILVCDKIICQNVKIYALKPAISCAQIEAAVLNKAVQSCLNTCVLINWCSLLFPLIRVPILFINDKNFIFLGPWSVRLLLN